MSNSACKYRKDDYLHYDIQYRVQPRMQVEDEHMYIGGKGGERGEKIKSPLSRHRSASLKKAIHLINQFSALIASQDHKLATNHISSASFRV